MRLNGVVSFSSHYRWAPIGGRWDPALTRNEEGLIQDDAANLRVGVHRSSIPLNQSSKFRLAGCTVLLLERLPCQRKRQAFRADEESTPDDVVERAMELE